MFVMESTKFDHRTSSKLFAWYRIDISSGKAWQCRGRNKCLQWNDVVECVETDGFDVREMFGSLSMKLFEPDVDGKFYLVACRKDTGR